MLDVLKTKSLHTSVLAALLFYLFANPSTFKMLKKFPGLQFVMKGIQVTQSGVVVNALLFGIVMFLCVYLINNTILRSYLNVVEHQVAGPLTVETLSAYVEDEIKKGAQKAVEKACNKTKFPDKKNGSVHCQICAAVFW